VFPIRDNVPTRHFPVVTLALIVANVAFYVVVQDATLSAPQGPVDDLAFHPCEVNDSCAVVGADWPLTAFTSMFMHADVLHLGFNMLFLWIFGNNVEDAMGPVRFLVFYLLGGLAATALQATVTLSTATDAAAQIPNLGASGAVSAVLGAYFVLLPNAQVLTVVFLVFVFFLQELPAWIFLAVYLILQAWEAGFQLTHPPEGGGTAVFAHLGGMAFGFLAVRLFQARRPLRPRY
jgi:membrane associated rhomboid family serine protease